MRSITQQPREKFYWVFYRYIGASHYEKKAMPESELLFLDPYRSKVVREMTPQEVQDFVR